jgi:hypothetical protein
LPMTTTTLSTEIPPCTRSNTVPGSCIAVGQPCVDGFVTGYDAQGDELACKVNAYDDDQLVWQPATP